MGHRGFLEGRYLLDRRPVAHGGMGAIWRASDLPENRLVAVKQLTLGIEDDPSRWKQHEDRLLREMQALKPLRHPNIVRYLDGGLQAGMPYLVMEWLEGMSLGRRRRQSPLSFDQILEMASQVLQGLAYCHKKRVIHRDIKPANIFWCSTTETIHAKLVDFGLALLVDESVRLTRTGHRVGTMTYMSPEQVRGKKLDIRTDLYSLGVVLYVLVTGVPPFKGANAGKTLRMIETETATSPGTLRPDLPSWFEAVILKAMARDPGDRYGSAEEMLEALKTDHRPQGGHVSPVSTAPEMTDEDVLSLSTGDIVLESPPPLPCEYTELSDETESLSSGLIIEVGTDLSHDPDSDRAHPPPLPSLKDGVCGSSSIDQQAKGEGSADEARGSTRAPILPWYPGRVGHLLGRERELERLQGAMKKVVEQSQPRCVLVHGPAGTGKSVLVDELVRHIEGGALLCLHGRGESASLLRGVHHALLLDALLPRTSEHGDWSGELLLALEGLVRRHVSLRQAHRITTGLKEALGLVPGVRPSLQQTGEVLEAFLRAACARGTVLLVLDGPRQDDHASLRFCTGLVQRLAGVPLMMVIAARSETRDRLGDDLAEGDRLSHVRLQPLDAEARRHLVRAWLGCPTDMALERIICERSGGNPRLAQELLFWLHAQGAIHPTGVTWELTSGATGLDLPATIEDALSSQVTGLSSPALQLLRTAAAFGEVFWEEGCQALGFGATAELLADLEAANMVQRQEASSIPGTRQWRFRHGQLRQQALAQLSSRSEQVSGARGWLGRRLLHNRGALR